MIKPKTIIFLDIDGVLQPHGQQDRFQHDMEQLRAELAVTYNDDRYLEMDRYDLAAVYYDWHKEAVERLRTLCVDYEARIVISSDWRTYNPLPILQAYFRLHKLDQYVIDYTVQNAQRPLYRAGEVQQYIEEHPEIERFVIIDDRYGEEFKSIYPHNFVYTRSYLEEEHYQRARQIFDGTLPRYEIKQIEESPRYGYLVAEIDRGRLLAGVGHTPAWAHLFPLHTPNGLNVLQAHAFDDPFHNGLFVAQNDILFAGQITNFWFQDGDWHQPDPALGEPDRYTLEQPHPSAYEQRGILRYAEPPHMEPLPTGFRFIYKTTWNNTQDQPLLDEVRTIDIYEQEEGIFCDLVSQKIAAYGDLEFQRTRFGALGLRVQPQLLPAVGGTVMAASTNFDRGLRRGTADWVANGRDCDYIAYEANVSRLGAFGVWLSGLKNYVAAKGEAENRRPHQRGWGHRLPDPLRGPWFVRDYGLALFNPTMIHPIKVAQDQAWTVGIRVVAYDGELTDERANHWLVDVS